MTHAAGRDALVERAFRHWERRGQAAQADRSPQPSRPFSIAFAREAGSGVTEVAREVGLRLGWEVYDRDLLEQIAREMGLRTSLLESVDERHVGWWAESVQQLIAATAPLPAVSASGFVRHLAETVLALGAHGECVIVGRGSAAILPPETTLRVRLVAPFPDRVARFAREQGLGHDEAARLVQQLDHERARFVRDHFHKDPADPRHFDLVLNTSRLSPAACADVIVQALREVQQAAGYRAEASPAPPRR
jgi:cytidylate kinase